MFNYLPSIKKSVRAVPVLLALAMLFGLGSALTQPKAEAVALERDTSTLVFPTSTVEEPLALETEMAVSWDPPGEQRPTVWNLSVSPLRDISNEVLALPGHEAAVPPSGMAFAGFDVEMTLIDIDAEVDPLPVHSRIQWNVVGGETNTTYNNGGSIDHPCGDFSDQLLHNEMFAGGTLTGTECIVIPTADLLHPDTVIAATDLESAYFGAGGSSAVSLAVPPLDEPYQITRRDGARATPFAFEAEETINFAGRGDNETSIWTVEFSAPEDITDSVRSGVSSAFQAELRDGYVFAGIDVAVKLETASVPEKSFSPYVQVEIFGGASGVVYEPRPLPNGCGPVADQFFRGDEVAVGGSAEGTLCMQIAAADVGHPNTRVALEFFDGSRLFFG